MARYTAFQLLATLFLIMSTSRVFVVAQQVTLNQAGAAGSTAMGLPATNTSAMQVAAILSNVFRDVSSNFAAVATGAPASASPVGAVPTTPSQPLSSNATLDPSIVQLLNQSMAAGMPANVVTAIQKALLQQQQAGSDLGTLQVGHHTYEVHIASCLVIMGVWVTPYKSTNTVLHSIHAKCQASSMSSLPAPLCAAGVVPVTGCCPHCGQLPEPARHAGHWRQHPGLHRQD
ncbi:hypothetical protein V8C86DRAFT_1615782 [Haematococcus lacustris]